MNGKPVEIPSWVCKECGHEVWAYTKPKGIVWTDGHHCNFDIKDW